MATLLTQIKNGEADLASLETFINGDENSDVTRRLASPVPTLAKLIKQIKAKAQLDIAAKVSLLEQQAQTQISQAIANATSSGSGDGNNTTEKLSYMFVEKAIPKVDSLVTAKITLNDTVLYGVYPIVGDQDREILKINHGVLFSWLMQNTHDEARVKNASQLAFYDAAAKNYYGELKHHLIYTRSDSGITVSGITQETQSDFIKKVSGYSPLSNVQFGSQPKNVLTIDKIPDELLATIKQKLTAHTSLPTVDFLTVLGEDSPIVIRSETPAIPWLGMVNTYYLLDNPTKQIHGSIPSYTNYFRGTPYKKEITLSEAQTLKQYSPTATIMAKLGTLRIHLPSQFTDKFTLNLGNENLCYFELADTGITLFTIQSDAYKPAGTIAYAENLYLDIIIDRDKTTYKFPDSSGISPIVSTSKLEYRLKDFIISLPPNNPLKIEWITT